MNWKKYQNTFSSSSSSSLSAHIQRKGIWGYSKNKESDCKSGREDPPETNSGCSLILNSCLLQNSPKSVALCSKLNKQYTYHTAYTKTNRPGEIVQWVEYTRTCTWTPSTHVKAWCGGACLKPQHWGVGLLQRQADPVAHWLNWPVAGSVRDTVSKQSGRKRSRKTFNVKHTRVYIHHTHTPN